MSKGEGSIVRYISRTKQQELSGELSLDGSYDNLDRRAEIEMSRDKIGTQSADLEKLTMEASAAKTPNQTSAPQN